MKQLFLVLMLIVGGLQAGTLEEQNASFNSLRRYLPVPVIPSLAGVDSVKDADPWAKAKKVYDAQQAADFKALLDNFYEHEFSSSKELWIQNPIFENLRNWGTPCFQMMTSVSKPLIKTAHRFSGPHSASYSIYEVPDLYNSISFLLSELETKSFTDLKTNSVLLYQDLQNLNPLSPYFQTFATFHKVFIEVVEVATCYDENKEAFKLTGWNEEFKKEVLKSLSYTYKSWAYLTALVLDIEKLPLTFEKTYHYFEWKPEYG